MAILEKLKRSPEEQEAYLEDFSGKMRKLRYVETRLLKASPTARAAIMLAPDIIDISAPDRDDAKNTIGVSVIGRTGVVLRGPVGMTGLPNEIRIGGMWVFNNVLLSGAPSTILTPISVLKFSLPLAEVQEMASTAIALGAIGTIGGIG